ncbi:MAG TPA: MFS transporter, partial [Candidatus Limnocylindrales bacterium]|nr:MFS transporter [Candidatus Limnocylindrales bacterium]
MLIGGIAIGLIAGLVLGGRFENLADVHLKRLPLLFAAVLLRFGTEFALAQGVELADTLRLPLFAAAYGLLLVGLWANRSHPGLGLAFVGILGNAIAIAINGGRMPVWEPSLIAAGFNPDEVGPVFHTIYSGGLTADFLLHAGPLGDVLPIPVPFIQNVASVGDLFLTIGLGFFLFSIVMRQAPADLDAAADRQRLGGLVGTARLPRTLDTALQGVRPETGLAGGLMETAALERPIFLGTPGAGLASPALAPLPGTAELVPTGTYTPSVVGAPPVVVARPSALQRARRHPYVRLALNGSFSALWAGQLISLAGDRVHSIALSFLVLGITDSVLASGLVFVAATLPNLLLSPIAGAFVDRWDHQEVMVVSDLLRAALVLIIPVVAFVNIWLVYPLAFLITTISIFFRPARVAILPRIVREDELLAANSALWVGETLADVLVFPLAGLFVVFLGDALPLAFYLDAVSYLASAVLLGSILVPPLQRAPGESPPPLSIAAILDDLRAGWQFLRSETVLLVNSIQGGIGQVGVGVLTALTAAYASQLFGDLEGRSAFAFMETAIGVGNLLGGFALGAFASRLRRGSLVTLGYAAFGACLVGLGFVNSLPLILGLLAGAGIANMVYIIPSQTLFQERTPAELIGRVIGFRFALVFGSMTLAMGVASVFGELFGPAIVIAAAGLFPIAAAAVGWLVPASRQA